jgi:hypothetical protein
LAQQPNVKLIHQLTFVSYFAKDSKDKFGMMNKKVKGATW